MAHEIAKLLLEQAGNFLERTETVRTALSLGMPLSAIEQYLDWLDAVRPGLRERCQPPEVIDLDAVAQHGSPSPLPATPGTAGDQAEHIEWPPQPSTERSGSRKRAAGRASAKPGRQPASDEPSDGSKS